jgi:anti-sigma regulatory factor (Ser/Thr protein kinase)
VNDEIQLVLPAQEDFHHIAHLVVGGLAARLELTFEQLEDLQLAVESLLACREDDGEITVAVTVGPESVRASIGPFAERSLAALDDGDGASLGLRRVLETVADTFEVVERDGGSWVELEKETVG